MSTDHRVPLAIILLLAASASYAATKTYIGSLAGTTEVPPSASPATGSTTVTYSATSHMLGVDVTFSGLTTGDTAAHIHCCIAPGSNTGVATQVPTFAGFPPGVTAGTYTSSFDLTMAASFNPAFVTANGNTAAGAEAALVNGLANGMAYMNIHTSTFPGGEIRALLVPRDIFLDGFEGN
jgi:hypothetical protein